MCLPQDKAGDASAPVTVPNEVTKVDAASAVSVTISSAELLDSIKKDPPNTDVLTNPGGKVLKVNYTYTVTAAAAAKGYRFDGTLPNVRVGARLIGTAGAYINETVSWPANWNFTIKTASTRRTEEALFLVPAETREFEFLWLDAPVAKGTVSK